MDTNKETFRDHVATIGERGKRIWLHPTQPKGKWYNRRRMVSSVLLLILFGVPFIKVNDVPLFLFNFLERKFILFGQVFWPQDFHLFVLVMITGMVFIVLFTVVFGRLWCGWACPQTLFMEMVFRPIEYLIEGTANQQRRLNQQEFSGGKALKKTLKHVIYIALSFLIANTLLAYVVGIDELAQLVVNSPYEEIELFIAVVIFTGIFYWVFSYFREQACTLVCPYGRLQSVFLDAKSILISYDYKRGEPREKGKRTDESKGDCIDCGLCVKVCPTGIDIRNGVQLECVNCTACIDECNTVMNKLGRDEGLIRYASLEEIEKKKPFEWTTRIIAYSLVLVALLGVIGYLLNDRGEFETTVLRAKGSLYNQVGVDTISNLYSYHIVNKTYEDIQGELEIVEPKGRIILVGDKTIKIPSQANSKGSFLIYLDREQLTGLRTEIKLRIVDKGQVKDQIETTFLGPVN